jgi:hypothetical protein
MYHLFGLIFRPIYIIYIGLKILPNSVRIRFLSWQIFCSPFYGIWTPTIDALQHLMLSLMSSALDHINRKYNHLKVEATR